VVRTIHTWRILGEDLVGTRHVATPGRAGGLAGAPSVGILLLNSGSAARSGNSDLSARIGDRLALRGFPVFRFDLPGLGDSSGPTPPDLDTFWSEVLNGRNDEATAALIARIQLEFGVARVVVGGLCAAVLPAVRALSRAGTAPAGLILLEPNFRMHNGSERTRPDTARLERSAAALRRGLSALGLGREGRSRRSLRALRARMLSPLGRHLGRSLPGDANVALIARWQESLAVGIHSLVVVAAEQANDRYVTRILESLPASAPGVLARVRVPDTNHLFTAGLGREAVLGAVERWALEHFGGARAAALAGRGS